MGVGLARDVARDAVAARHVARHRGHACRVARDEGHLGAALAQRPHQGQAEARGAARDGHAQAVEEKIIVGGWGGHVWLHVSVFRQPTERP